jgi:hypothetical protein
MIKIPDIMFTCRQRTCLLATITVLAMLLTAQQLRLEQWPIRQATRLTGLRQARRERRTRPDLDRPRRNNLNSPSADRSARLEEEILALKERVGGQGVLIERMRSAVENLTWIEHQMRWQENTINTLKDIVKAKISLEQPQLAAEQPPPKPTPSTTATTATTATTTATAPSTTRTRPTQAPSLPPKGSSHRTLAEIGRDTVAAIEAARKIGMPKNNQGGIAKIGGEDILDVSVNVQMRRWPAPPGHCNTLWGWGSTDLWRRGKFVMCRPDPKFSDVNASKVVAYHRTMHRHAVPDTFVDAHNVAITFKDLSMAQSEVAKSWPAQTERDRSFNPSLLPSLGSLRADCTIDNSGSANWLRFDQIKHWFGSGANRGVMASTKRKDFQCTDTVRHTVMITSRDGHANMFHSHEDIFNAWVVMATLDVSMRGLQHYFTDGYPKEPLLAIWQHLLGDPALPVLGGYELGKKYSDAHYTCYKRIIWNMPGVASPWATLIGSRTRCRGCPLFKSYGYAVMSRLGSANLDTRTYAKFPPPPLPGILPGGGWWEHRNSSLLGLRAK